MEARYEPPQEETYGQDPDPDEPYKAQNREQRREMGDKGYVPLGLPWLSRQKRKLKK